MSMANATHRRTVTVALRLAALSLFLAGCHAARTAPAPMPAAPACPAPALDPADWTPVSDSAGVTYRVPDAFVEQPPDGLPYRRWKADRDLSGYLWFGLNRSNEHWITLRRVPSLGMHEMSECVDSVAGREALIQAWRTAGGIFEHGQRRDRYDVFALVPIEPGLTLTITGGAADRRTQEVLLAVVRTVAVSRP